MVIDPGAEAERIIEAVRSRDLKVKHILLTLMHFDHMQAAADVAAAPAPGYSGAGGGLAALTDPQLSLCHMMPGGGSPDLVRCGEAAGRRRWWRQAS